MRRTALRCAAALVMLVGASGCAVRTVDCWQLAGADLEEAETSGRCGDAFALNSLEIVPLEEMERKRVRKLAALAPLPERKPVKKTRKR